MMSLSTIDVLLAIIVHRVPPLQSLVHLAPIHRQLVCRQLHSARNALNVFTVQTLLLRLQPIYVLSAISVQVALRVLAHFPRCYVRQVTIVQRDLTLPLFVRMAHFRIELVRRNVLLVLWVISVQLHH